MFNVEFWILNDECRREGSHGDTGSAEDAEDECLWQEQVYLRR